MYNIMLVSGVQHSASVIYVFFFRFFCFIGYYKILRVVPCATTIGPCGQVCLVAQCKVRSWFRAMWLLKRDFGLEVND